jgi:hypothetical protein
LPEYAPPLEKLKLIKVDWKNISGEDLKKAREEWSRVFMP